MCSRVKCSSCGKPSFSGCGRHVEQVLGDVPAAERCKCREEAKAAKGEGKGESASLLARIFGI